MSQFVNKDFSLATYPQQIPGRGNLEPYRSSCSWWYEFSPLHRILAQFLLDTPEAVPGTSLAPPARCMCFRALHCACGRLILSIQLTKLRFPETEESTLSGRA